MKKKILLSLSLLFPILSNAASEESRFRLILESSNDRTSQIVEDFSVANKLNILGISNTSSNQVAVDVSSTEAQINNLIEQLESEQDQM